MDWWPEYTLQREQSRSDAAKKTGIAGARSSDLQRHQRTKPRPQYGSRQMATSRDGYSSHCSLTERQKALVAPWDI